VAVGAWRHLTASTDRVRQSLPVLGLPDSIRAFLFDLDGVLTQTATVHAAAWKAMFDAYLAERARREGLNNLSAVTGTPDDAHLPEKVDLVLMVDVYHHIEQRVSYFRKLAQSLKPKGRVAIIDFNAKSRMGPPPSQRIAAMRVAAEMVKAGYLLLSEHHILPNQYFLVFRVRGEN
jgi:phosphoglycolate phosphatase-like HAD superfamily hydrolase